MLYLVRGIPGSGKSTLAATMARALGAPHYEHDQYLTDADGTYRWTPKRMGWATKACVQDTQLAMALGVDAIVVSNVFPTPKSMRPYRLAAEENGYGITYIVVENRRGGKDVHEVPQDALDGMRANFQVEIG